MAYEVSVITPFHNIDPAVFRKALISLRKQTLGFERLEWIVVLHNSAPEYEKSASDLLAGYPNVRVEILHNGIHSPSSPRNRGLELASAPYVAFLDGDDSFTPWCLEKALDHIRRSGAEIVWFRREYELESEGVVPVTEVVLWNQTQEEIIIDRDHGWDNEKLFSGVWAMVTSRLYDRSFLDRNHLRFDETVSFGEDYLFNLEAYGCVRRLCYLPQMIGYHYFINNSSLVQKNEKTAEALLHMARGFTKIFDAGLKRGFYMDAVIGGLLFVEMRFMMSSPSLTLQDRCVIRDLLKPYLDILRPVRVSKLYSEKAAYERCEMVRDYFLNPEKWASGDEGDILLPVYSGGVELPSEMRIIRSILDRNSGTDYGERYGFRNIVTVSGYQSAMPVTRYEDYRKLIELTTRIGESGHGRGLPACIRRRCPTCGPMKAVSRPCVKTRRPSSWWTACAPAFRSTTIPGQCPCRPLWPTDTSCCGRMRSRTAGPAL